VHVKVQTDFGCSEATDAEYAMRACGCLPISLGVGRGRAEIPGARPHRSGVSAISSRIISGACAMMRAWMSAFAHATATSIAFSTLCVSC